MGISIAICTHKKWELVSNCLSSIKAQYPAIRNIFGVNPDVFVVNNAIDEPAPQKLKENFMEVEFIDLDVDLFVDQRNYSFSRAKFNDLIYFDDDFTVNENFPDVVKYFSDSNFGLFQFHFLGCIDFVPPAWFNMNWVSNPLFQTYAGKLENGWVSGCCMGVKKDLSHPLMFNPNFGPARSRKGYSSEDGEFEVRFKKEKGAVGYHPLPIGLHHKSLGSLPFYVHKDNKHYRALQWMKPSGKEVFLLFKKVIYVSLHLVKKPKQTRGDLKIHTARFKGAFQGFLETKIKRNSYLQIPQRK